MPTAQLGTLSPQSQIIDTYFQTLADSMSGIQPRAMSVARMSSGDTAFLDTDIATMV
jgi:hypothetical protein